MVLQRLEGLSDREAVERYCFDNRWRYAAGVGGYDTRYWVISYRAGGHARPLRHSARAKAARAPRSNVA
jgi:hypothetical protein